MKTKYKQPINNKSTYIKIKIIRI